MTSNVFLRGRCFCHYSVYPIFLIYYGLPWDSWLLCCHAFVLNVAQSSDTKEGVFTRWLPGSLSPLQGWVFWSQPRYRSPPQCSPLSSDPQNSPETQTFNNIIKHGPGLTKKLVLKPNNLPSRSGWLCGWHLPILGHCCTWRTEKDHCSLNQNH